MSSSTSQQIILIEGAATYERILAEIREVEVDEGIRHMKDFLKIYPDFARAHNDLAVMYYQTENLLKALAHYEKAHKLDPSNVTYRKNLADFYFVELEWTGDAINVYLNILKDNPFDIESLNALGTISLQIGRKEQARQYFTRTLQLDTTNQDARQVLQQFPGSTIEQPRLQQLKHVYSQPAATVEPIPAAPTPSTLFQTLFNESPHASFQSPDELYREAARLVDDGKQNEAIDILEFLIVQDDTHALSHNDLGVLFQMRGDLQKSRLHHEAAVSLNPENIIFRKNLADLICSGFADYEGALAIYVKLYSENRHDIEILKAIAHICLEVGKPDDAKFFFEQILAIKPWDIETGEALRTIKTSMASNAQ